MIRNAEDLPRSAEGAGNFLDRVRAECGDSHFDKQVLARTGLNPDAYLNLAGTSEFRLHLPAGYRRREVLDFYGRDPLSISEHASADEFRKAFLIGGRAAVVEIRFIHDFAVCATDATDTFAAHRAIVRMLGFGSGSTAFEQELRNDPLLGALITKQAGLRIPLTPNAWEALAWAIIGQQISLKFAVALRRELIAAAGEPHPSGLRAHPSREAVASLDVDRLRKMKFSAAKAEYLLAAARSEAYFDALRESSAEGAAEILTSIRGVGPWTAQYALLRGFGFADCLPAGDAGIAQGLHRLTGERPTEPRIREIMARFTPYRSLATYHVWASLKPAKGLRPDAA